MKIAYNPITADALSTAPANNDITFDLRGLNIFVRGVKFKGTDTTYLVFKKHTSSSGGGYNGLVPVPSYTSTNVRFLREDGTWLIISDTKVTLSETTTANFRPVVLGYQNSTDRDELSLNTTNLVYTTTSIYAQPSTGFLYANKLFSGGKEVATAESLDLSRYVTLDTTLNIVSTKIWTSSSSDLYIGYNSSNTSMIKYVIHTSVGWARGYGFSNQDEESYCSFGAYGQGTTLVYQYVGNDYQNPWQKWNSTRSDLSIPLFINNNKVWHAGNDGEGSGMDADLIDGTHKKDLFTLLTSSASTNLSVTIGGTTKAITDLYATTAEKLGSSTVGGPAKPIYLDEGTPTALSLTVGSTALPVYLNAGTISSCVGSSIFSNLSNSGNNISITVAGQNRVLTPAYATVSGSTRKLYKIGSSTNSLTWTTSSDLVGNGITAYTDTSTSGRWDNYGAIFQFSNVDNPDPGTSNHWLTLIWSGTTSKLGVRWRVNTGTWTAMLTILTSSNYYSYINKLKVTLCNSSSNSGLWNTIKGENSSYIGTFNVYDVYNNGGPNTYGNIIEIVSPNTNHWQPLLWFSSGKTGSLLHRNKNYNDDTWGSWYTILDSNNYTNYIGTGDYVTSLGTNGNYLTWTKGGTTNNITVPFATNSDTLDGFHASKFYENGYVLFGHTIDASSLNTSTYYPVTISIGSAKNVRIECIVSLNSRTKPSWSSHSSGFSVRKIWEVNGSGWGTNNVNRRILVSDYLYASADPVRGIGLLTNSSIEYVYVRGGGKYFFYISHNFTPTLRTSTYTTNSLSVSPTTSAPAAISTPTLTFLAGKFSAVSYKPLTGTSTINIPTSTSHLTNDSGFWTGTRYWANIAVSTTSSTTTSPTFGDTKANRLIITDTDVVKHIEFSRAGYNYLTTPSGGTLALNVYGGTTMGSSTLIVLGGQVFSGANNSTLLGTSSYRWSNVYSVLGNFSSTVTANGFVKSGSSNSYVLLGGGGHKALTDFGYNVKYYAKYSVTFNPSPVGYSFSRTTGNYNFISSITRNNSGSISIALSYPSGYTFNNTIINIIGRYYSLSSMDPTNTSLNIKFNADTSFYINFLCF